MPFGTFVFSRSKVSCEKTRVDSEIVRELANHLPAEALLPGQNLGDRGLRDRRVPAQLCLRDSLGFHEVPKHVGAGGRIEGVVAAWLFLRRARWWD
jgi:hypothetical protein